MVVCYIYALESQDDANKQANEPLFSNQSVARPLVANLLGC